MRKRNAHTSFDNFFRWMGVYRATLRRVREPNDLLTVEQAKEVFEAFVPKVAVQWDILSEDLIIDCVNRDTSQYAGYLGEKLPKHIPSALCEVMLTGLRYFDFKGVSDLKGTAKKVLVPSWNPFQAIPPAAGKRIDQFFVVRNYLAHYSRVSERSYAEMCRRAFGARRFREPQDFLFAKVGNQSKTRFEREFIDSFEVAAKAMAAKLNLPM